MGKSMFQQTQYHDKLIIKPHTIQVGYKSLTLSIRYMSNENETNMKNV